MSSLSSSMLSPTEMSDTVQLKAFVIERLTAAAEEIFGVFENVIKYYDEDPRSKGDVEPRNRLLDVVTKPHVKMRGADPTLHPVHKEEVLPEQQERSPSLGQEEPEAPQIKEEQEELWTSQDGEQLQWLEEADTKDSIFAVIPVVSLRGRHQSQSPHFNSVEHGEGEPFPSTSAEQMDTEADEDDRGSSEPTTDIESHCPAPYSSSIRHRGFPSAGDFDAHDTRAHAGGERPPHTCGVCGKAFRALGNAGKEKPYTCGSCERQSRESRRLALLMKGHCGGAGCGCGLCGRKLWATAAALADHRNTQAGGQRPHCCSVCGKGFSKVGNMKAHMSIHTGEKPYSCSVCERRFRENGKLTRHMKTHTGEKPYRCSVCGKGFSQVGNMRVHMRTHAVS